MDTSELLPSLAQGDLADTSAPELVAAVFRSRASGTLWLETEESNEIRCFFRAGDMCGTGSFRGFQTLAHVLLANDWVAALDIDGSYEEAQGKNRRHGEVLVERGFLTHDQLRTALGAQHTANLTTILGLTDGKYDWRGWEPPPPWAREVVVDPVSCVIDALEQDKFAARRQRVLDWMGDSASRLSLDWPELQGRVMLQPLDRRAAALLALPRRLDEFVQASRLPRTRAEALLVALLLAGGVEPQPRASAPPPVQPPEPEPLDPVHLDPVHLEALVEPEPEPVLDPLPEPLQQAEPPSDPFAEPQLGPPPVFDDSAPLLDPQPELDLSGALPRRAPQAPRRATVAEDEALKRLDSLSLDDEGPLPALHEPSDEPLEIDHGLRKPAAAGGSTASFSRNEVTFDEAAAPPPADSDRSRDLRKKMVSRGMRNLGAIPQRAEEAGGGVAAADEAPAIGQIDESQLSPEDQRLVDEVRSRLKMAGRQDAYGRLGVAQGATTEQVKTAYLALAKRFHPDRAASPALQPLHPEMQSLFALLKEAYETVGSAEQRAAYEAQGRTGGPKTASRKEEATLTLKMGEVLLKKRDFEGALNKLRRSVDLEATGDALAALAWALVSDPKSTPALREEAATLVNRALRAPGVTARTYYVAGVLWRTKDPDSAVDAFRKALEIDPSHSDAALELRLIEQRRGKQQKTGGGVLSGLLFGKRKS